MEKKKRRQTFVFSATLTLIHGGPDRIQLNKKKKFKMTEERKLGIHVWHNQIHATSFHVVHVDVVLFGSIALFHFVVSRFPHRRNRPQGETQNY